MAQWWEQDQVVGSTPAAPSAKAGAASPRIMRAPGVAEAQQRQAEKDALSQNNEAARLAIAQAQLGMSQQDQAQQNAEYLDKQRTQEARGGVDSTESERTAAFLTTNLRSGIDELRAVAARAPDAASPRLGTEVVRRIFGEDAANYQTDANRQQIEAAQVKILDSALTLGTGAAYNREQLLGYTKAYFPQLGDKPETIAAKQANLIKLLEAAKIKAGASAPLIDQAIAAAGIAEAPSGDKNKLTSANLLPDGNYELVWGDGRKQIADSIPLPVNEGDEPPPSGGASENWDRFAMGVGDLAQAAGDTLGIVSNPLNTGINAVFGTDLGTDLGASFREVIGAPKPRTDSERMVSAINRGVGGVLSFGGAASLARNAPGLAGKAANALLASPLADVAGGAGAGAAGEYARQNGAGPVGQVLSTLAGGASGAVAGNALAGLARPTAAAPNALMRAGQSEGVTVNRAMADPAVQNRVTGAEATLLGGPLIRSKMGDISGQIERGVRRLGQGGEALTENVAGSKIAGAADRYIKTSGAEAKRLYDRAEKIAGDTKVPPTQSLGVVDGVIAKLSETAETNAAEIAFLEKLRSDFSKDLSVGALRRVRTSLRKRISRGELVFGEDEKAVLDIMDAASADIADGLQKAGKGAAAKQFQKADAQYRERMAFIGDTVQKLVGKRGANVSPEKVFSNFKAMATPKGDEAGMARMLRTMEPEERADIAATFADALGKSPKGEFSTAYLVSQAEKLPAAAKSNVFGVDGADSLQNLVALAKEHSRVMSGLNNSRTGVANDYRSVIGNVLFGGGTGLYTESGTAGIAAAGAGLALKGGRDVLSARAVMNKDLSRWLAKAPATRSPGAINRHYGQLAGIAARNPAIAGDVQALQQAIWRVANDNYGSRVAASEEEQKTSDDRRP